MMATCLIGLGSNLGDRAENVRLGIQRLASAGQVLAASGLHTTKPVGGPPQADFVNAAAVLETAKKPEQILPDLQDIERQLGRRRTEHWGPRSLDLDLLLYDLSILETPSLVIPHPRMAFRRFVLAPASEIAGQMLHPTTEFTVRELLERLDRRPIHIAVLGKDAAGVARAVANQVPATYFERPPQHAPLFLKKLLEFLRDVQGMWIAATSQDPSAIVSDFWVGEIWSVMESVTDAAIRSEIQDAWRALPQQLIEPHLVVWLEEADRNAAMAWEGLRRNLVHPRQFPVLTLREPSLHSAAEEIAAAVEAMN